MSSGYGVEVGRPGGVSYIDAIPGQLNFHPNGVAWDCSDAPMVMGPISTIAAAGNAQGNATAIPANAGAVLVTGADGTKGAILPVPSQVGQECNVVNTAGASALKIYPDSGGTGGTIQGAAANAAYSLAAAKGAGFVCTALSPTAWWSLSN